MAAKRFVRWTKEEDSFLIENYKNLKATDLSALMSGRTVKAVQRRAHNLGISNKTPKITLEKVRKEFLTRGFSVSSQEYKNSHTPIKAVCSSGHSFSLPWNKFKNGRGCQKCYYDPDEMYGKIKDALDSEGYSLLTNIEKYEGSHVRMPIICPNGHRHSISWNEFDQGNRCGKCNLPFSRAEKEVYDFVLKYAPDAVSNTKEVINPFELDIFIPNMNLAIEYCGLRWHSENVAGKPRNYHRKKMTDCAEKEIRLITIFEDEWLQRPEVVKSRITQALNKSTERVFARKLTFEALSTTEARSFLNVNHLQGYSPSALKFGLKDSAGSLAQVMTFGKVTRAHAGGEGKIWELKRLAAKIGTSVVGGASKLFKNSLNYLPKEVQFIKSYCDLRWASTGTTVYQILGFKEIAESKYTPHYTKRQKRYRNHTLRKTPEERLTGKTEWELRREQGFDRIWDCGHKTYLFEIRR